MRQGSEFSSWLEALSQSSDFGMKYGYEIEAFNRNQNSQRNAN